MSFSVTMTFITVGLLWTLFVPFPDAAAGDASGEFYKDPELNKDERER